MWLLCYELLPLSTATIITSTTFFRFVLWNYYNPVWGVGTDDGRHAADGNEECLSVYFSIFPKFRYLFPIYSKIGGTQANIPGIYIPGILCIYMYCCLLYVETPTTTAVRNTKSRPDPSTDP